MKPADDIAGRPGRIASPWWRSAVSRATVLAHLLETQFKLLTFMGSMIPTVAALGLQFVTFAITARGLGVEQFGAYSALLAIVGTAVEVVGLGGGDLLVRAVSRDRTRFPAYFGNMLLLILMTMPIVVLCGVVIAVAGMHSKVQIVIVAVALLGELLVARLSASLELIMVAHGQVVLAGWVRLLTVVLRLAIAALYFVLLSRHSLAAWVWVMGAQALVVGVAYILIPAALYGRPVWVLKRRELAGGSSFCLSQSARAMQSNMDRMVLSRFAEGAALGIYSAASRILQLGLFPIQVAMRTVYANFYVHGAKGLKASRDYALQIAPALLGIGVLSAVCVAGAAFLAPVVLGRDFAGATATTIRLACSLPLIALQYPAADALSGAGLQSLRARIYIVAAGGFGFLLVAGVKLRGIDGLIWSFVLGHFLLAAVLWACTFVCTDRSPKELVVA
jgi:O-antigen/teichoic acid export membrane protein